MAYKADKLIFDNYRVGITHLLEALSILARTDSYDEAISGLTLESCLGSLFGELTNLAVNLMKGLVLNFCDNRLLVDSIIERVSKIVESDIIESHCGEIRRFHLCVPLCLRCCKKMSSSSVQRSENLKERFRTM